MAALSANSISNPGQNLSSGDRRALFLKVFAGEVLTAFSRTSVMMDKQIVKTIAYGKSSSFPVMGRTHAKYLEPGNNLDDQRKKMEHTEKVIEIDGLLTADCLITDIDDAMNHYEVRAEYSKQLGEALAMAADCASINELANTAAKATGGMPENIPKNTTLENPGTGKAFEFVTGQDADQTTQYGNKLLEGLIAARAAMTRNWVPQTDRYFLVTPEGYSAIIRALMPDAANYQALFDPNSGKLMNVCGFQIVETPNLGAANDGVDGKHALKAQLKTAVLQGIAFHRSAVGMLKLRDLRMERARRAEYQADQIIASMSVGYGGLRPEAVGVFVKTAQVGA